MGTTKMAVPGKFSVHPTMKRMFGLKRECHSIVHTTVFLNEVWVLAEDLGAKLTVAKVTSVQELDRQIVIEILFETIVRSE